MSTAKSGKDRNAHGPFQAPRGMRDLSGKEYFAYQGFFEKAAEVALYYGFTPYATPTLEQEAVFTSGVGEGTDIVEKELYRVRTKGSDKLAMRPEGTAGIMRAYIEHGMQSEPQPVSLYYAETFFRHDKPQRGRLRELRQFGIEMIGTDKSISDALTIKILLAIFDEVGVTDPVLSMNSIGDKECRPIYRRELTAYYRKHVGELCQDCIRRLKDNPLRVLDCKNPTCQVLKEGAPDSIAFLCELCKKHFKAVLEYLDSMNIEYVLDKTLVRGLDYYSRTVFEITVAEKKEPKKEEVSEEVNSDEIIETKVEVPASAPLAIAGGGRYDYLGKMLGSNRDIPGVGGAIGVDRVLMLPGIHDLAPRIVKKPKVFFIQLGFDAKLKSVSVIEILREARIPLAQTISKDSLGSQLAMVEKLKVPFAIILGQKEVLEDRVIVRNMENHSQQSIPMKDLANYIKSMK